MKYFPTSSLLLLFFMAGCSTPNSDDHESENLPEEPTEFMKYAESLENISMPHYIDEWALYNIDYDGYQALTGQEEVSISKIDGHSDLYLVGSFAVTDSMIGLMLLESFEDTTFSSKEVFYIRTFSLSGDQVANLVYAEILSTDKHHVIEGVLNENIVTTEKYKYEFNNGAWTKIPEPIQIKQYTIQTDGKIIETGVFINTAPLEEDIGDINET